MGPSKAHWRKPSFSGHVSREEANESALSGISPTKL
jgi:hypothetical protein